MTAFKSKGDIKLRALEKEDAEFLRNLVQRPEVRKYLGRVPEPISLHREEDRIEQITEDDSIIQFIIEKENEKVGTIALFDIDRTYKHGMHRVAGGYLEDNEASRKVQGNFGFKEEGREREYKYRDGEYIDLVRMSLLEEEYRRRHSS
ncbi:MAG: GNAT family N-acetyltransferase [Candidatus Aenigmatarchaeota archaeon]